MFFDFQTKLVDNINPSTGLPFGEDVLTHTLDLVGKILISVVSLYYFTEYFSKGG